MIQQRNARLHGESHRESVLRGQQCRQIVQQIKLEHPVSAALLLEPFIRRQKPLLRRRVAVHHSSREDFPYLPVAHTSPVTVMYSAQVPLAQVLIKRLGQASAVFTEYGVSQESEPGPIPDNRLRAEATRSEQ